ncbi:MAG: hypothetical protein COB66_03130 [Coxiella sp. (in: Bacteria)]|nr:MAG: hypothetical protein COB66_03130 [Coxiella sp. (in: g-proteobacteria)]
MPKLRKIAILATGDEITNGDILNTNGQFIAQALFDHNIQPGMQLSVCDHQEDLENAMRYLLAHHDGLITIGGLGPTSDDRTRFALANVLDKKLVFDDESWKQIEQRLKSYGLDIPESNRQQCEFPEGSEIFENTLGTANSCCYMHHDKPIFMLPGPPKECKPLLEQQVVPRLIKLHFLEKLYKVNWLTLGFSEGHIAEQLDKLVVDTDVQVGYRAAMPYIEIKLFSTNKAQFETVRTRFLQKISPQIISENRKTAKELFYDQILTLNKPITIIDNATKGYLASQLLTPDSYKKITFPDHPMHNTQMTFIIDGLKRYWEKQPCNLFVINIVLLRPSQPARSSQLKIPNRGNRSLHYATEYLCWQLLKAIN